jgi:hypothetical protein
MADIISYCKIYSNKILKENQVIVDLPDVSLDDFLIQSYENLKINYPKFYKMDRICKLGLLASEVILSGQSKLNAELTSVILSNSNSSLDTDIRFWDSTKSAASPSLFVYTLPNIVAGEICIRHGFKGESNFFVTPEFDAGWIVNYVNQTMASEIIEACLAGWVDVLSDHAEVFLYLTNKSGTGMGAHTAENIRDLYHGRIGSKS